MVSKGFIPSIPGKKGIIIMSMNFSNCIGAYSIDVESGKWTIIGASDEMNISLNTKLRNNAYRFDVDKNNACELSVNSKHIEYNNYNDICQPLSGIPKYCYGTSYGNTQIAKINEKIKNTLSGAQIDIEEIIKFFKDCCRDMRVTLIQDRKISGMDQDANKQIILDTYEQFRSSNSIMAKLVCDEIGEAIAKENGWKGGDKDWIYYDSDLYYLSEKMRTIFKQAVEEISLEWGLNDIDTSGRDEDKYLSYSSSFNQVWENASKYGARICNMIDPDTIPPTNFRMFFRECLENNNRNGIIQIEGAGEKFAKKVVFDIYNDGIQQNMKQEYNLGELFKISDDEISKYLSNIEVYTRRIGTIKIRTE